MNVESLLAVWDGILEWYLSTLESLRTDVFLKPRRANGKIAMFVSLGRVSKGKWQRCNALFPGRIFLIFRRQGQDLNRLVHAFECMTSNQNKMVQNSGKRLYRKTLSLETLS